MAVDDVITSPVLTPCLETSQAALTQTTQLIEFLSQHASSPTTTELQLHVARQQKIVSAYLSRLRLQTRKAAYAARTTKLETAEARKHVDGLLLQLQNLYYEQRHLSGEIASCEDYNHSYRDLPLIDTEEYLERFPDQQELSEEELMPNMIEFEAAERARMEQERLDLMKVKEKLIAENMKRKEDMKKMDEKLEAWIDGLGKLEEDMKKDL